MRNWSHLTTLVLDSIHREIARRDTSKQKTTCDRLSVTRIRNAAVCNNIDDSVKFKLIKPIPNFEKLIFIHFVGC